MTDHEEYMEKIVLRGNQLILLEQAVETMPKRHPLIRFALALAAGGATLLMPAISAAQMLLM